MKNEMTKLINALTALEIPHEVIIQPFYNTPQVWLPSYEARSFDVICHEDSYGGSHGLLEMWDTEESDSPVGWMTATEVLSRILKKF